MSAPQQTGHLVPKTSVHLLPMGEQFRQGYGASMSVAVCGELVTSEASGDEDARYCPDCIREAIRWNAQPIAAWGDAS